MNEKIIEALVQKIAELTLENIILRQNIILRLENLHTSPADILRIRKDLGL